MLVLSRKQQQQIKIGDQITVTIVKVKGNTVRVGIEAPRDVRVIRAELPKEGSPTESIEAEASSTLTEVVVDASELVAESTDDAAPSEVISFRVRCESTDESPALPATRSAAHLPLKRLHDRFGNAPLKQLMTSCATLAK